MKEFINDSGYITAKYEYNGKSKKRVWVCPYFSRWVNMKNRVQDLKRCSTCCPDWYYFSNFKQWLEHYNFQNKELDKDLICFLKNIEPRMYSPETCLLLLQTTNAALPSYMDYILGDKDQGLYWTDDRGNWQVRVRNKGYREFHGRFEDKEKAKDIYFKRKLALLCDIIEEECEENRMYLEEFKEVFINART